MLDNVSPKYFNNIKCRGEKKHHNLRIPSKTAKSAGFGGACL
jgi:hypothetical protein